MEEPQNHSGYILECRDGTLYTGYTNDFNRRLQLHEKGKGAKYTRGRRPFKLMYYKLLGKKKEAMQVEYKIKRLTRKQKVN